MGILNKRKRRISKLESTGLVKLNGSILTLITDNLDGTIDINHGGSFDNIIKIDPNNFESETISGSWIPTVNIDHTVSSDGNLPIIVDKNGTISIIQLTSGNAFLPVFSATEPDLNSHVQIGSLTKSGGSITFSEGNIIWNGNINNRLRYLLKEIGTLASLTNPSVITAVGGNLELNVTSGDRVVADLGFEQTEGFNPEQFNDNAGSPVFIVKALRDNTISGQSLDLDVNNYESSIGVLTSKGSSKASNNFMLTFQTFIVQIYGQVIYSGGTRLTDASQANESPEIPNIAIAGGKIEQISVDFGETNLSSAIFKKLNRFN